MKHISFALLAVLLLSVPTALANHDYSNGGYYGNSGGGRSFESYERQYDTTRSDIVNHNIVNTNTGSGSSTYGGGYPYGYGNWYYYQPNFYGVGNQNQYGGSNSYSNTNVYSNNYNRNYNEKTKELIKVDRYTSYDDRGIVHLTGGPGYSRGAFFYGYDYPDSYVYRYPYAGASSGDRGYYSQPYYSSSAPTEVVVRLPDYSAGNTDRVVVPPLTRYASVNQYTTPINMVTPAEGPSQAYSNRITDRGPLYAPMVVPSERNAESGGATRNSVDRSTYTDTNSRDSQYIQVYTSGRRN